MKNSYDACRSATHSFSFSVKAVLFEKVQMIGHKTNESSQKPNLKNKWIGIGTVTIWQVKQWQWHWHCGVSKWRNLSGKNELQKKVTRLKSHPPNPFGLNFLLENILETILSNTFFSPLHGHYFQQDFFHSWFHLGGITQYFFSFFHLSPDSKFQMHVWYA